MRRSSVNWNKNTLSIHWVMGQDHCVIWNIVGQWEYNTVFYSHWPAIFTLLSDLTSYLSFTKQSWELRTGGVVIFTLQHPMQDIHRNWRQNDYRMVLLCNIRFKSCHENRGHMASKSLHYSIWWKTIISTVVGRTSVQYNATVRTVRD